MIGKPKLEAYTPQPVYFTCKPAMSKHAEKLSLATASCLIWSAETVVGKNSYITNELDKMNTSKSKVLMESFVNE